MEKTQPIREFVQDFREQIEPLWSDDLKWKHYKGLADDTASAGYCGPSSILLWRRLQQQFPEEWFSLAVGIVYRGSSEFVRGKHVWVVWHHGLKSSTIIDVTADQSRSIEGKVIVENIDSLSRQDIHYSAYKITYRLENVDETPKRRAAVLEHRLEQARFTPELYLRVLEYYEVAQNPSLDDLTDIETRMSEVYAYGLVVSFRYCGVPYYIIDDYSLKDSQQYMKDVLQSAGFSAEGQPVANPHPQPDGSKYAGGIDGVEYYLWKGL